MVTTLLFYDALGQVAGQLPIITMFYDGSCYYDIIFHFQPEVLIRKKRTWARTRRYLSPQHLLHFLDDLSIGLNRSSHTP